jgi:DNA-binding response OmpR family regulator
MKKRILVVEDDTSLATVLHDNLSYEGFEVELAGDGREAIRKSRANRPHLLLLDVMIPGIDGFDVCRTLSAEPDRLPIIILTSKTNHRDKVQGLELGADDYVTKPFVFDELLARIHAVLRRTRPALKSLQLGDVHIDFGRLVATRGGVDLALTGHEFAVLQYLAERAGTVVSRDELLRAVWRYRDAPMTRVVDNLIVRLRRKIEPNAQHPRYIRTVYGDGYCLASMT